MLSITKKIYQLGITLVLSIVIYHTTHGQQVSFRTLFNTCCSQGKQWAESHQTCAGQSAPITGVLSRICIVVQEKCCMKANKQKHCKVGLDTAKRLSACEVPTDLAGSYGGHYFKTCCDCCEMGLKSVELELSCNVNMFGHQCNKAYQECCLELKADKITSPITKPTLTTMVATTSTITTTITAAEPTGPRCATDSECQQICRDTSVGMICSCRKGYRLHSNRMDCVDINECLASFGESCKYECKNLPGSYECFCPEGYRSVNFGSTCKDVDECTDKTSCNDGQACFNTHGSHRCVSLECPTGYTKISNTKRCTRESCRGKPMSCIIQPKQISFHNVSLSNGTKSEEPLFRMSLVKGHSTERYTFLLTDGNEGGEFTVKSSTRGERPTGIVYTAKELVGPRDYILNLILKLYRGRRWVTFVSKIYIFVGVYDF